MNDNLNLINFYLSGNSLEKTANQFNCSTTKIKNILYKNNITTRNWKKVMFNKRIKCDDNYFCDINSPDKAYFLGWMVSDGWINKKGMGISLNKKDENILYLYKKYINYQGNIGSYTTKNKYKSEMRYLILTSESIKNDLAKWGVVPRKSHKTYFPPIPKQLYHHFIRGIFDGDGTIDNTKKSEKFAIIGNIDLIQKIQEILIEKCKFKLTKLQKLNDKNTVIVTYGGKFQCETFYNWLYKDCEDLYLKRKKEKFEKIWKN